MNKSGAPYIFDHAVYVRCGASLFTPSTFPRNGIGVGPGGVDRLDVRIRDCPSLSFRVPLMASSIAASARRVAIMEVWWSEPSKNGC